MSETGTAQIPAGRLRIDDREELMFLLGEAAELEHGVLCSYLFAAFTLKTDPGDGLSPDQTSMVKRWRRSISSVAVQEMIHLTLVNNLLTAIGGAPHLSRPNLPQRSTYAPEIQLTLAPFSEETLERFLYIERPEGMDISSMAHDFQVGGPRLATPQGPMILAQEEDFSSIGELYRGIERGLHELVARYGEREIFVGPPRAQATQRYFRFPELVAVTDLASAVTAIETIVEEGEGARGNWQQAHFGRFVSILQELRAAREQDPGFAPARSALENPYARAPAGMGAGLVDIHVIGDPATVEISDLCNASYAVMLHLLYRFFGHTEETDEELETLADTAVDMMEGVIRPLGELLTTLPAGPRYPGMTAGPNFITSRLVRLTPHKEAAWCVLRERVLELARYCDPLCALVPNDAQLTVAQQNLQRVATRLGATPAPSGSSG